ncbi:MAG: amino acid ABC transporter ATP-binding protein [Hyphomicrobiales bacterium]|jgi:ABC-type polar amino acid transport system ATPase subunit
MVSSDNIAVRASHVSKWFGRFRALAGVSLTVQKGGSLVLCGPSGSGKSTLLRCLNGLEQWDQGEVNIGDTSVGYKTRDLLMLRRRVGMVFQNFNLFPHLTVLDNIALPPRINLGIAKAHSQARASDLLQSVGLAGLERKYPAQLSGGQQQRVAIARALAMEPEVLLFDEPTSALDPESIGDVLDVMAKLADAGRTMIVVTHEMGFARCVCNDVVFMADGQIVETASPDVFFDEPKTARAREFLALIC